jgi:hypothetical protein
LALLLFNQTTTTMNIIMQDQPRVDQKPPKGMLLHCGAEIVSREELWSVPTPDRTRSWFPIAHSKVLTEVEDQLGGCGFLIKEQTHSLTNDGSRYFGVLNIAIPDRGVTDFSWVVGIRNSHDKTFPAGLVAGTRVFVCDNLAFSGEVSISRKHTRWAERDLHQLTARAVGQLGDKLLQLDHRIARYKEVELDDARAHDIVIRSLDAGVVTTTQVPDVLREWREPSHSAFLDRNAWSLFNAFTETHKRVNPHTAIRRGEALHGLFDMETGALGRN